MEISYDKSEISRIFLSLNDKINELTSELEDFVKMANEIIENRANKFLNRLKYDFNNKKRNSQSKLIQTYQIEVYKNIKHKLENKGEIDNKFEKYLLITYKKIKKLSQVLNIFENNFISLIINNFSNKDIFNLRINLLMKEFNDKIINESIF